MESIFKQTLKFLRKVLTTSAALVGGGVAAIVLLSGDYSPGTAEPTVSSPPGDPDIP